MMTNVDMYLNNKYTKWYYQIIENAKQRIAINTTTYYEKHHIIPRSLGGDNLSSNLAKLTAREHFICHMLLTKMATGVDRCKMLHAVGMFSQKRQYQQRHYTSWEYKKIRESISKARLGVTHSIETRLKISQSLCGKIPHNKGKTGYVMSETAKQKISAFNKGKILSEEHIQKISNSKIGKPSGMLGKRHSEETKLKMSMAIKAAYTPELRNQVSEQRKGIRFSVEHLANLKIAAQKSGEARQGKKQKQAICIHCGKTGGRSVITRYHDANCKQK